MLSGRALQPTAGFFPSKVAFRRITESKQTVRNSFPLQRATLHRCSKASRPFTVSAPRRVRSTESS